MSPHQTVQWQLLSKLTTHSCIAENCPENMEIELCRTEINFIMNVQMMLSAVLIQR